MLKLCRPVHNGATRLLHARHSEFAKVREVFTIMAGRVCGIGAWRWDARFYGHRCLLSLGHRLNDARRCCLAHAWRVGEDPANSVEKCDSVAELFHAQIFLHVISGELMQMKPSEPVLKGSLSV